MTDERKDQVDPGNVKARIERNRESIPSGFDLDEFKKKAADYAWKHIDDQKLSGFVQGAEWAAQHLSGLPVEDRGNAHLAVTLTAYSESGMREKCLHLWDAGVKLHERIAELERERRLETKRADDNFDGAQAIHNNARELERERDELRELVREWLAKGESYQPAFYDLVSKSRKALKD